MNDFTCTYTAWTGNKTWSCPIVIARTTKNIILEDDDSNFTLQIACLTLLIRLLI